jgi:hypothetical protein
MKVMAGMEESIRRTDEEAMRVRASLRELRSQLDTKLQKISCSFLEDMRKMDTI